jgi:hypothetical protein
MFSDEDFLNLRKAAECEGFGDVTKLVTAVMRRYIAIRKELRGSDFPDSKRPSRGPKKKAQGHNAPS